MRRWFRRLRLAVASLLVLLAVGLLVAWPVTMRHAGIVALRAGPEWERWWYGSVAYTHGWQSAAILVSDDDQPVFKAVFDRIELDPRIQQWVQLHRHFADASRYPPQDKSWWLVPTVKVDHLGAMPGIPKATHYVVSIHTALLAPILLLLAFLLAFGPIRRKLEKRYRVKSGLCLLCGYNLAGVEGTQCPECGADRSMVTFHRGEA